MKFATRCNGTRDGELLIVSRDLTKAVLASSIAPILQGLLDNWDALEDKAQALSDALNNGTAADIFDFDQSTCESPLPRAYQWADGSAYVRHVELVRKARNAAMPETFWTDPLMYQGGSDVFIGPRDDIQAASEDFGIDMEAEIAVITDDIPMAASPELAASKIRLLMLVNDVSFRGLIPGELAKGFGFFQSKPSSAFSPVAITADELGDSWDGKKLHLPLVTYLNDKQLGNPNCGEDMTFDFPTIVAHAAKTRALSAGTIIGSGTISNAAEGTGSSCLAEVRMIETIETGSPITPFMRFGDSVRIEMLDKDGNNIFGTIDQTVVQYQTP